MGSGYQVYLEHEGLAVSGAIGVDLYSRQSVGWEARDRMKKALAISALHKAIAIRQPTSGVIQHADRGQYVSDAYCTLRKAHSIIPSMRGKGHCYDTAINAIGASIASFYILMEL